MQTSRSELTYKGLSDQVFFWHALSLHLLCVGSAYLIHDITILFDLFGAVTCAFSIFFFPAIGFLCALAMHNKNSRDT